MKNYARLAVCMLLFTASTLPAQDDIMEAIKKDNLALVQQRISVPVGSASVGSASVGGSSTGKIPLNGTSGTVPLLLAIQNNAVQTAQWLLAQQGIDTEVRTQGGSTPLSLASYFGNSEIVSALIQAGAKLGAKTPSNGYQPLDWALENRHWKVVAQLFFAWGMQEASGAAEKEVLNAVRNSTAAALQHQKDFTSFPLLLAIAKSDAKSVETLLTKGFSPNQQNAAGYAPLPTAARLGDTAIMKLLLLAGADPNIGGTKGNDVAGALNQAARGLNVDAGKLLLQCGANVNKGNAKGVTPLFICAWYDRKDGAFTNMLLSNKAIFRQKAENGDDALDAAMETRNRLFMRNVMKEFFLRSLPKSLESASVLDAMNGASKNLPQLTDESGVLLLNYAIVSADSLLFAKIMRTNINVNTKNVSGHYPLPLAASWGEKNMLKQLLERGADPNVQNENRYHTSALMESTRDGHNDIAEELLRRKATVNLKDAYKDNALNWAVFFGRKEMVQLLLANGADFKQIGQQSNDNALDIALRMKFPKIAEMLRSAGARASK